MRLLTPVILLIVSGVAFFMFIDPTYSEIRELQSEQELFAEALDNSKELQTVRDELLSEYNSFSSNDLQRLEKMLPNSVDNVRLVRDLDGIAEEHGMTPRNVTVQISEQNTQAGPREGTLGSVLVSFSVNGSYETFQNFLQDLEKSLRLMDIVDVSFTASEQNLYEYNVSIRTYWIK